MKMGLRSPSVRKSFSSRTTGKINRAIKKSINPLYGKKGIGYINNPERALYNKIYNKTTTSIYPKTISNNPSSNQFNNYSEIYIEQTIEFCNKKISAYKVAFILCLISCLAEVGTAIFVCAFLKQPSAIVFILSALAIFLCWESWRGMKKFMGLKEELSKEKTIIDEKME